MAEPDQQAVTLPGPGVTISFETHIKSLFRSRDRESMIFAFDLWSPADVQAHATDILDRLRNGTMPCDGAWPQEKTDVFERWTESGFPALAKWNSMLILVICCPAEGRGSSRSTAPGSR